MVPRGTVDKQQDPILNALALAQAPNMWVHYCISDGNMYSHFRELITNAQSKVRKLDRWWLIVSARALLNQMVDRTLSPDELGIPGDFSPGRARSTPDSLRPRGNY
jgi:hypothetical protein